MTLQTTIAKMCENSLSPPTLQPPVFPGSTIFGLPSMSTQIATETFIEGGHLPGVNGILIPIGLQKWIAEVVSPRNQWSYGPLLQLITIFSPIDLITGCFFSTSQVAAEERETPRMPTIYFITYSSYLVKS